MFEKFRQDLEQRGFNISRLTLAKRFDHMTKGGDGVYYLWLFYFDGERLRDLSCLLLKSGLSGIKQDKKGNIVGFAQIHDYLEYYIPELKQISI